MLANVRGPESLLLGGVPVVVVIIVTWDGGSFYHCCVTNSTDLVAKQNQSFYYTYGFSGSGILKGHDKEGSFLLHDVWNINWEGLKSRVSLD